MSNIKQAKEIVSKELSLPASKLVGGTVANNAGTLEGTDLQLMYSEGYANGTAKNTSEVLAGTTTIAPTWVDGTNYVKKVKDGSWVAVENEPVFGVFPDFFTGREAYKGGKWYGESASVGSTVDYYDPFFDGSGVALYQLDGDADALGGNYDGTANNVTYGTGKFGQAGVFNGSSSWIATLDDLQIDYSAFTISGWFKTTQTGTGSLFFQGNDGNNNAGINAGVNFVTSGKLTIRIPQKSLNHTTTTTLNDNTWHQVILSFDSTGCEVFIDGTSVASNTNTSAVTIGTTNPTRLVLGKSYDVEYSQDYFNGMLDQFRVIGKRISSAEALSLYNEELPLFTELPPQTYLPYTVEATAGSVTAVNEWKYPDLVTETSYSNELRTDKLMMNGMEAFACRAWVNFNGTFSGDMTIENGGIRASGNVSSITDNGTGDYTVNFATAMPDANFSTVLGGNRLITDTNVQYHPSNAVPTTTSISIATYGAGTSSLDWEYVQVVILR